MKFSEINKILLKKYPKERVGDIIHHLEFMSVCNKEMLKSSDELSPDAEEMFKFITGTIERGDIVYVFSRGMYLVTDVKPAIAADGKHFRAFRVNIDVDGMCRISTADRTVILMNTEAIRVRKSSFPMDIVEKCSLDRYLAWNKLDETNQILETLTEQ